jgi:hypothetical protein
MILITRIAQRLFSGDTIAPLIKTDHQPEARRQCRIKNQLTRLFFEKMTGEGGEGGPRAPARRAVGDRLCLGKDGAVCKVRPPRIVRKASREF